MTTRNDDPKELDPIYDPINGSLVGHRYYSLRKRSWSNTGGFKSVPSRDLPVNSYSDEQVWLEQPSWGHHQLIDASNGNVLTRSEIAFDKNGMAAKYVELVRDSYSRMRSQSSINNELVLKTLVKIADTKANIAVSLKEASKTSDLILGTANRVYGAYRAFRRGRLREVARLLNLTPNTVHKRWLEYKYGWMPLLMEIKGAAEFFAQTHFPRPLVFQAVSTLKDDINETFLDNYPGVGQDIRSCSLQRVTKVKIWCEIDNPHLARLQQLGVTNPALYAWEVIPFSFVVDWFISVGDYLTGISALHGISVKKSMVSVQFADQAGFVWQRYGGASGGIVEPPYGGNLIIKARNYSRSSISVDPLLLYPPVQLPDTWAKLISGLALIKATR